MSKLSEFFRMIGGYYFGIGRDKVFYHCIRINLSFTKRQAMGTLSPYEYNLLMASSEYITNFYTREASQ